MKALIVVAVLTVAAFAQTAKVVVLKPEEAAKAKQLHAAADKAKKAAQDFDDEIAARYTQGEAVSFGIVSGGNGDTVFHTVKDGWQYGFEFSEDWQFIVPKPYQATAPVNCWENGGIVVTPALADVAPSPFTAR